MLVKSRIRNEKGSMAIYAIATVLCFIILLGAVFISSASIRKNQIRTLIKIKDVYADQLKDANDIANKLKNKPKLITDARFASTTGHDTEEAEDSLGNKIVIPKGFKFVSHEDDNTVIYNHIKDDNTVPSVQDGIVIEDESGNQFVWVPVPDITQMVVLQYGSTTNYRGKLYGFTGSGAETTAKYNADYKPGTDNYREPDIVDDTSDETGTSYDGDATYIDTVLEDKYKDTTGTKTIQEQFKAQLQAEFNSMVASVQRYGGFYIGRYETGGLSGTAVVQKGNDDINNQNWYTMYYKNKELKGTNNNVTTSMIWGCQWDQVMNWWLKDNTTKGYVTDSSLKGNYSGTNGDQPIATGNDEYDIKNIYDMAGNVWDWTIEANSTDHRVVRGGNYGTSGSFVPVSARGSSVGPTVSSDGYGSRSTLLVNP